MTLQRVHRLFLRPLLFTGIFAIGVPVYADLGDITGKYFHKHESGNIQGDFYSVTDLLEITSVDSTSINVEAVLHRFNGHTCSLSAQFKKLTNAVYVVSSEEYPKCKATLQVTQSQFIFFDSTMCLKNEVGSCGLRAGFDEAFFKRRDKLP